MREIKFRGFSKKHQQWLTGNYILNRGAHFIAPVDEPADGKTWEDYEVDPDTVGQFTGLTDKNGREIYEGDIVLAQGFHPDYDKKHKCIMAWDKMDCRWRATMPIGVHTGSDWPLSTPNILEIIGNIHEHHELFNIKQEQ